MPTEAKEYRSIDKYDRKIGELTGLPDTAHSKPSTIVDVVALTGDAQTYIVQTFRQREKGDTIFVQSISAEGSIRIVLPPAVADAIARQSVALTGKIRRKLGREQAAARKARGEVPGFLKGKKAGKS